MATSLLWQGQLFTQRRGTGFCELCLRACLVRVRVKVISYAVAYEKAVSDRSFRYRVDPFAAVSTYPKSPGKTPYSLLARCFGRHLLRLEKRLPLAAFAPRLPSLVYRLLSLQKVPIEWAVGPYPQSPACGREEEGRQESLTDSGHPRLPKYQDRRRIGSPKWLRRSQEHQRAQAPPLGGHSGASALGLRHPRRHTR